MMAENEVFCDETFAAERRREARGRKGGAFWKWDERFHDAILFWEASA
ncbi:MAG: hypothetical protein MSA50_08515 [Veillonellaceae bacterium]|jgi:hypothetical protein|nr:hypothetical protein [Veillonellaceae bacterium]